LPKKLVKKERKREVKVDPVKDYLEEWIPKYHLKKEGASTGKKRKVRGGRLSSPSGPGSD
jgi:hypothetical protein